MLKNTFYRCNKPTDTEFKLYCIFFIRLQAELPDVLSVSVQDTALGVTGEQTPHSNQHRKAKLRNNFEKKKRFAKLEAKPTYLH